MATGKPTAHRESAAFDLWIERHVSKMMLAGCVVAIVLGSVSLWGVAITAPKTVSAETIPAKAK